MKNNNFWKKITVVTLAVGMSVFISACGNKQENQNNTTIDKTTQNDISDEDVTEDIQDDTQDEQAQDTQAFNTDETIKKTVLVDEKGIKITGNELIYENNSVKLAVTIENNSKKDIKVTSGTMGYSCNSVNGYMISDGYLNSEVKAGKKANEEIQISFDELQINGITEIADIGIGFSVKDKDYKEILKKTSEIKTAKASEYDYEKDTYQEALNGGALSTVFEYSIDKLITDEIYNQKDVKIISEALVTNSEGEKALLLEVENGSDKYIGTHIANLSVNGLKVYSGDWAVDEFAPRKRKVISIELNSGNAVKPCFREKLDITDISNVTFEMSVKDLNGNDFINGKKVDVKITDGSNYNGDGAEIYNKNNIKITSMGIVQDEENEKMYELLIMENSGKKEVKISAAYDSLSINGIMADNSFGYTRLSSGEAGLVPIEIEDSFIEENNISEVQDIKDIEITYEIEDEKYDEIDTPKLKIVYEK